MKSSCFLGAKDYVETFYEYLVEIKTADPTTDFSLADLENLKWFLESETAPTWDTYAPLV